MVFLSWFWSYKSHKNDQATRLFLLWKKKVVHTTTKFRYLNTEALMVKPLSASCVNTVVACSEEIDNSERIDPHPNQKQELVALWYMHVLFMVV